MCFSCGLTASSWPVRVSARLSIFLRRHVVGKERVQHVLGSCRPEQVTKLLRRVCRDLLAGGAGLDS